jgi:hypothetical protein
LSKLYAKIDWQSHDALRLYARMRRENPDLQQLEVPNRGHVPLRGEPECIAALDDFLRRIP